MELCERGDLAGRVKKCQKMRRRIDERTIWANMVEMAEGLAHLHSKNISHRDLKPGTHRLSTLARLTSKPPSPILNPPCRRRSQHFPGG